MNWDDLQILAAVGDSGSFSGAAKALGYNHSSISRRMRAMEKRYDVRLFERQSHGLVLTGEGEELYERANRMAGEARSVERQLAGLDSDLAGTIRFATLDSTGRSIMPLLKSFLDRYPGISLEILLSQSLANLTRNEADVVLRATNRPPETYVGRHIATHHFAVFGSQSVFANADSTKPLNDYPWVLWADGFTDDWMSENVPNPHCVCRVNTALGMVEAIRSGMGVGHIACLAGDADAELRRITAPHPELNLQLWLLLHQDLKRSQRVRVFCDYLVGELQSRKDLIEGRKNSKT